ncbi:hypothetical protein MMSR116_18100 [Methylobacterium mesophilicum SR1.6/6]|uniref:Uncharacterized protein n=1 Tax=Methylobacterium mesophilicum SR1.6/6 TaxID=908290 RepID=A0A6B9FMF4_9HYPH|nr:hypothetical protein [Methylobacterium mesophilicum]QGY03587.1 hypothetical protein MMSR116_18100 [Methylobacterium mesophilicum SR1.6/6]
MADHDLKPGARINCPQCGALHEATAYGMIENRDDARCRVCRANLTHWPQYVGLRLVDQDEITPTRTA